jgi:cysteine desulfurase
MDITNMPLTMRTMATKGNKRIFLDYAAATPMSDVAMDAYRDASRYFANPQALHTEGLEAARVRDDARSSIAKILGVKSQELTFTSGGTESNNLALAGYLHALEEQGIAVNDCHIAVSEIEHPSVFDVCAPFVSRGLRVTKVRSNKHGEIKPEAVTEALQQNTVLVSVGLVNSEIGTIQPIHAIGTLLRGTHVKIGGRVVGKVVFHTDAAQGMYHALVPQGLGVDLMTLDSGKMYGPRGTGALYVRHGVTIAPVLRGGSQEEGRRPGTENVALYAGFAAAFKEGTEMRETEEQRLTKIREELVSSIGETLDGVVVNGTGKKQAPHILNISIADIDSEYVAMYLDQRGIALSTKSACLERTDSSQSHVVAALGGETWRAQNTLRLSFGRGTDAKDIPQIVEKIKEAVAVYQSF